MGRGREQMLDEIALFLFGCAFAGCHADNTFTAASLGAKRAYGRALDKTAVGNADNAALIRDQVFHVDLVFLGHELGETG